MSTKSPSMIARWRPINRTSLPVPPAATGRRREQARDLNLLASPLLPTASGGLVGEFYAPASKRRKGFGSRFRSNFAASACRPQTGAGPPQIEAIRPQEGKDAVDESRLVDEGRDLVSGRLERPAYGVRMGDRVDRVAVHAQRRDLGCQADGL